MAPTVHQEEILYLTFGSISAPTVHRIELTSTSTPNDLKRMIGRALSLSPELLQLSGPTDVGILCGKVPLCQTALKSGDHVTYLRRSTPDGFNFIGECHLCDDIAHIFWAYMWDPNIEEWAEVIATCFACGGRKFDTNQGPNESGMAPWPEDYDEHGNLIVMS